MILHMRVILSNPYADAPATVRDFTLEIPDRDLINWKLASDAELLGELSRRAAARHPEDLPF